MSLQFIYELNNSTHGLFCPESSVLESLTEHFPEEMTDLFGFSEEFTDDIPTAEVESDQLIQSIDNLLKGIRKSKEIVPYTYKIEWGQPGVGKVNSITSGY